MKCHYENIRGVGRVLIPGCMAVAVSGDIEDCICRPTTFHQFEKECYKNEVERLKDIIKKLEDENEYYRKLLTKNRIITED